MYWLTFLSDCLNCIRILINGKGQDTFYLHIRPFSWPCRRQTSDILKVTGQEMSRMRLYMSWKFIIHSVNDPRKNHGRDTRNGLKTRPKYRTMTSLPYNQIQNVKVIF